MDRNRNKQLSKLNYHTLHRNLYMFAKKTNTDLRFKRVFLNTIQNDLELKAI